MMDHDWEAREFHTHTHFLYSPNIVKRLTTLDKENGRSSPGISDTLSSMCSDPKISFTPVLSNLSYTTGLKLPRINWTTHHTDRSELEFSRTLMDANEFTSLSPFPENLAKTESDSQTWPHGKTQLPQEAHQQLAPLSIPTVAVCQTYFSKHVLRPAKHISLWLNMP